MSLQSQMRVILYLNNNILEPITNMHNVQDYENLEFKTSAELKNLISCLNSLLDIEKELGINKFFDVPTFRQVFRLRFKTTC